MSNGHRIIEGLRDAIAGNFARVTIDGQTWVRAAEPVSNETNGWRDIESAPKDGTKILAFAYRDGKPIYEVTWWRRPEDRRGFVGWGEFNETFWPAIFWQALPPPPLPTREPEGR